MIVWMDGSCAASRGGSPPRTGAFGPEGGRLGTGRALVRNDYVRPAPLLLGPVPRQEWRRGKGLARRSCGVRPHARARRRFPGIFREERGAAGLTGAAARPPRAGMSQIFLPSARYFMLFCRARRPVQVLFHTFYQAHRRGPGLFHAYLPRCTTPAPGGEHAIPMPGQHRLPAPRRSGRGRAAVGLALKNRGVPLSHHGHEK